MNVSDYNTIKTVLKKAEQKTESQSIGIIEIVKERGFIDKRGRVHQRGNDFSKNE